jgi:para-aminobenzoate synthetase/4-amino-4-deoxychorismate lyase
MITIETNDVLLRDRNRWLCFRNPYKILIAKSLDEVVPALAEIERLTEENEWHAAGFLSYESASAFDQAMRTNPTGGFPYLWFGLYSRPVPVLLPRPELPKAILEWRPTINRDSYHGAISRIKEYISQGKTYQVNFTMRLHADFKTSPWVFFLHLALNQNNHAAYIDTGRYIICSASPELFFELEGDTITSCPMKGTVKRGRTTIEDREQADWLKNSEKNRAENVMIVDMIRNDLGRIARTGSVRVNELFCLERYPTLWQMTSTIPARTEASLTNIFRALFPCASITGAPKIKTMQIIDELEPTPRKIYTGSIGYIAPGRKAKFNVAIRTLLVDQQLQTAEYGVGGGIVWDSVNTEEYTEALLKVRLLTDWQPEFSLLENLLWTPTQGFYLRKKHIERLLDSVAYFDFAVSRGEIEGRLDQAALAFNSAQRIRFLLDRQGKIKIESAPFQSRTGLIRAHVAKSSVNSDDVFLFHKTTYRTVYKKARADFPDCEDVLLYNQLGELTEFSIGNLVVELDSQLMTPPKDCGLLAGTFRAYLVETGQVVEKVIPIERLRECTKLFRVNSIRTWEKVEIQSS